jgi:hypothetical protein
MPVRAVPLAAALFACLAVAACGGSGSRAEPAVESQAEPPDQPQAEAPAEPSTQPAPETEAEAPAGSPFATLLSAVPDTPGTARFVSYVDLEGYYAALGIDPPPRSATSEEANAWLGELVEAARGDVAPLIGGEFAGAGLRDPQAYRDEIGVDPADIAQSIETGEPPETYHVVRGSFDAGTVDEAVRSDPGFSDLLEEQSHGEVSFYSWGEDFEQHLERNSPVHTLGRGGRLALYDGLLFWSFWTGGMAGMIDAATGTTSSLADREDFGALAARFDALGVYWVQMTAQPDVAEGVAGQLLAPYVAIGAGGGADDDGAFLAIVVAHADSAAAEENVVRLRQWIEEGTDPSGSPWTERIESAEIGSDGLTATARLRGPDLPWDVVASGLTLLGHG